MAECNDQSAPRQVYTHVTKNGEIVRTVPGKKGPGDMIILTTFPRREDWPHSLEYIGACVRFKGLVEQRDYHEDHHQGVWKLIKFLRDCILRRSVSIEQLCAEHQIPGYPRSDGRCCCGQPALPNDKWCKVCREALNMWDKL